MVTRGREKCSYTFLARRDIREEIDVVLPKIPMHE
jgi:hypothetical protein